MSELGSKKGQSENKNAPIFDSSELETKQKTDHFVNVKDAEARKKEAERKAKEVEKKAENEHKEAVKEAAKKANKEVRGSKGGILNLLFGGWRKAVTVVILLALILLLVYIITCVLGGNNSKNVSYKEKAESYYAQQRETVDVGEDVDGYISARDAYKERYNNASNEHEKFYEGYFYSLFVYFEGINFYDALRVFNIVEIPEDYTMEEACDLKDAARYFYEDNDFSSNKELEAIIKECKNNEEE